MKYIFILLLGSALALGSSARAQGRIKALEDAQLAMTSGSAKALARYFNDPVELGFDGNKGSYSQTQAEFVVRDFFRQHAPTGFQYLHDGASREGLRYAIGKYQTAAGAFRVYMLLRDVDGSYRIDTLDFSQE